MAAFPLNQLVADWNVGREAFASPATPDSAMNTDVSADHSVDAGWSWDDARQRLWIEVFASGEPVAGAYYRMTVSRELVEHVLAAAESPAGAG